MADHWRAGWLARRNGSDGEMGGARSLDWPRHRIGGRVDRRRDFPSFRHLAGVDSVAISLRDLTAAFIGSLIFLLLVWMVRMIARLDDTTRPRDR